MGGLALGALGGWLLSLMLVQVLTGVFDPPPEARAIPWLYLTGVGALAVTALAAAAVLAVRMGRRPAVDVVRQL